MEDALADAQRKVARLRRVAAEDPSHRPTLAMTLDGLGLLLGVSRRRDLAAAATQEAVDLYRDLARAEPAAYRAPLATTLANLGGHLSELGKHSSAVTVIREAVELSRDHPAELASALTSLGLTLSDMGRLDDAIAATLEAIALYRPIVIADAKAHAGHLAAALAGVIQQLHDAGRAEDARPYGHEAAGLRRWLQVAEPDMVAFIDDLIAKHGYVITEDGRYTKITTPAQPSTMDETARQRVRTLNARGLDLIAENRLNEAVNEFADAIHLLRAQRPTDASALGMCLHNHALALGKLGRTAEALYSLDEAIHLRRMLVKGKPDLHQPLLAESLNDLGRRLGELGRHADGLIALEESVALFRKTDNADGLAMSVNNLAIRLCDLRRHEEALTATDEALDLYRRLSADNPAAYLPLLAMTMDNLELRYRHLGRHRDARAAAREAKAIRRGIG
ncbi:tetratricopeptide repeat protein [Alloactinosynnema sp. L-07]|uniref:tetratricopeptide repeat protein n=1 Tax=Alloactinosynnema sp. L-07 TaxID=1653480 RepID=UPI000A446F8F|nr:tetratricopeptide repeat protein [Alloactinosynnema sp. L-07]